MSKEELKTSEEWQKLFPNVQVLDPDGWDRQNWDFSWHQEKISQFVYEQRVMESTCMHHVESGPLDQLGYEQTTEE
jgi:hypothetical protein